MLNQLFNMDRKDNFIIACSGGVDSMAVTDFYRRGNKNFTLAYFHHGTAQADHMEEFIREYSANNNIKLVIGKLLDSKPKKDSWEEFWRNERYNWLKSFNTKIVTCHHLNDAIETWIFSSLHGKPKVISPINGIVNRPFLLNTKQNFIDWCNTHNVKWVEDLTNKDVSAPRNRIRHNIIPECLFINPGLAKVIKKKIIDEYSRY
jgi:tRNA(Ile)-lysidine synthase